MKKQRILLLVVIAVFFVACYTIMNFKYDPLARYPYVTDENREQILDVVSKQDIQLLIDEDIRPEEFLPFIEANDFQMKYAKAYASVFELCHENENTVVSFVNQVISDFPLETLQLYLQDYSVSNIIDWVNYKDPFHVGSTLVLFPSHYDTVLNEQYTVGRYEPTDLVAVSGISQTISSGKSVRLRQEASEALTKMCALLKEDLGGTCGGLIAKQGYMSYIEQQQLYDQYLLEYGPDEVSSRFLFPGHNEWQLGNSLQVTAKKMLDEQFHLSTQYQWLNEHAHEFGFIVRYPQGKEMVTKMVAQPYTLRYVGVDLASYLHQTNEVLEEMRVKK